MTITKASVAPVNIKLAGVTGLSDYVVVVLDPGGTTGIVWAKFNDSGFELDGGQISGEDHHDELYNTLSNLSPTTVVSESFDFRQHRGTGEGKKTGVSLVSREYIGVAKLWCQRYLVEYVEQSPWVLSSAMCTDEKLDRIGLLGKLTLEKHFNDAVRHFVYYAVGDLGIKGIARLWL